MRPVKTLAALAGLGLAVGLWARPAAAGLRIERITGEGETATVAVTYTNTTGALHAMVKITCAPPGASSRRERAIVYLSNHLGGGIPPGYTASATLSVPLNGKKPGSITCTLSERPVILP